jgi:hypothetical protein
MLLETRHSGTGGYFFFTTGKTGFACGKTGFAWGFCTRTSCEASLHFFFHNGFLSFRPSCAQGPSSSIHASTIWPWQVSPTLIPSPIHSWSTGSFMFFRRQRSFFIFSGKTINLITNCCNEKAMHTCISKLAMQTFCYYCFFHIHIVCIANLLIEEAK